jgi:hypothetical protein
MLVGCVYAVCSMGASFMQTEAFRSQDPLTDMIAVSRVWPFDRVLDRAITEYIFRYRVTTDEALAGFDLILARDPYSADSLAGRMEAEFELGQDEKGLADWRALARLAPNSPFVADVIAKVSAHAPH